MTIDELINKLEQVKKEYDGNTPILVNCDDDEDDLPYHQTFAVSWHPVLETNTSYWPEGYELDPDEEKNGTTRTNALIILAN